MDDYQLGPNLAWHRPDLNLHTTHLNRHLDRLPNPRRQRARMRYADGKLSSPEKLASLSKEDLTNTLPQPIVAVQNTLPPDQSSVGISLVIFTQLFGGSLFLSFAETTFTNGIRHAIPQYVQGVSAETVIAAGATAIRQVVSQTQLPGVLLAYNQAVSHTFYLAAAAAAVTFFSCWGMGWKNIKKAKVVEAEA